VITHAARGICLLLIVAAACTQTTYPVSGHIDGTVIGNAITGAVTWTVRQVGDQVDGTGTFTRASDSSVAVFTVRGRWQGLALSARLVGAPGDSDADSVWFAGSQAFTEYVGVYYEGTIRGNSTVLYGPIALHPQ
jgi:hypothetical protein